MKRLTATLVFSVLVTLMMVQPVLSFQKTYGGPGHEYIYETIPTADGGFAFVGYSESSSGDLSGNHGMTDLWVAKANAAGTLEWSKNFGGSDDEEGLSIVQGSDLCYYITGWTSSTDNDLASHSSANGQDVWVLKLSSAGNLMKHKCYGGTSDDESDAIAINASGVIYIAASTYSDDGDVTNPKGYSDVWVLKLDTALNLVNQLCVGGTEYEVSMDVICTSDGGCALTGRSSSSDGNITGYHAGSDLLVVKMSAAFALEWAKCFGGSETEEGNSIVENADGSLTVLGYTSTHNNGDVTGHHGAQGSDDFWLLNISSSGTLNNAKCYGGSGDDQANGLDKCSNGGWIMSGLTNSTDGDVSGFHASFFDPDYWVARVDASGNLLWQRCCGGSGQDESFRVYEESPNVYVVTGFTYSPDYDVTNWKGDADGWIIKVTGSSGIADMTAPSTISFFPNPANDHIDFSTMMDEAVLFSMDGQLLVQNLSPLSELRLPALNKGIYTLRIKKDGTFHYAVLMIAGQ
jgi:hypothetical protein